MTERATVTSDDGGRPPYLRVEDIALFLDVDGTLLDFSPSPMGVDIPAGLRTMLRTLHEMLHGALALISGRRIATLDELLELDAIPAAGLHGLERRVAGGAIEHHDGSGRARLEALAPALESFAERHAGVLIEDKAGAIAVHYRAAPEHAAAVAALADELAPGLAPELVLQRGHMVVELRPAGADKGTAIARFMAEPPFAGRRAVFVGDDLTDEHGFEIVNRDAGVSIKVGRGPSVARYRLDDPADVLRWLEDLAETASTERRA